MCSAISIILCILPFRHFAEIAHSRIGHFTSCGRKNSSMRCTIAFQVVSGPVGVDISVQMLSIAFDMSTFNKI